MRAKEGSKKMELKEQILRAIDKNSKLTAKDLALMFDTTPETVTELITQMEKENVICGYPTLINWDNTDQEKVMALIEVKVTPQRGQGFDKIAERIYKFDEVESVYLMSGGFDLTVIIQGKSMREVSNFVSSKLAPMEAVLSTTTHFVLKKYKEHSISLVQNVESDERMLVTP